MELEFDFSIEIPADNISDSNLIETTKGVLECYQVLTGKSFIKETSKVVYNRYDDLDWTQKSGFTERTDIVSFGTKMLPGAGGFYYATYADGTHEIKHIDED